MKNIDRIKNMTTEEMASVISDDLHDCRYCPCYKYDYEECFKGDMCDCRNIIKNWLESEEDKND